MKWQQTIVMERTMRIIKGIGLLCKTNRINK